MNATPGPSERSGAGTGLLARLPRFLARAALVGWVPLVLVPSSYLLGFHVLGLPVTATANDEVARAFDKTRSADERGAWLVVHVLYSSCGCSKRVAEHLIVRGKRPDVRERVELVGDDPDLSSRLSNAGFVVESLAADELGARYHIDSAPLLVAIAPSGALGYLGGYTARKQSAAIAERDVIDELVAGREVAPLPNVGCAVSQSLKKRVDPLGLKD